MIDQRERFERAFGLFEMPEPALERMLRRRDRKQRNRRISAAALALVVAAGGLTAVVRAFGSGPEPGDGSSIVAIPIDLGASSVAVGEGGVWVSGRDGISRVDPATNEVVVSFPGDVGTVAGTAIAVGEGAVWAVEGRDPEGAATSIVRIDPVINKVVATIVPDVEPVIAKSGHGGAGLWGITTGLGSVWAGAHHGGALLRIDPATNEFEVIPMPRPAVHVGAVLDEEVWLVATKQGAEAVAGCGELTAVDPASNGIVVYDEPTPVCYQVRAGFSSLWMNLSDGSIVRFDTSTQDRLATIDLPDQADGVNAMVMAVGDDAVWVGVNTRVRVTLPESEGVVFRIDPDTNEVVGELHLATVVQGVAAGEGAVWVTDGESTLYRIDLNAFDPVTSP